MRPDALAAFVQAVAQSGLLGPDQVGELQRLAAASAEDPQSVAREAVTRGWLTPLQARAFWKGDGQSLFVGNYVLVEKVGEGGMGEVYRARHRHMGRDVALKVIRSERLASPAAVARFQQEVRAAAQLSHPNVVMTYDAESEGDRLYLAMEFVEGPTLTALVRERGPLPVREACEHARQIAVGLQHAHDKGLVHRDIKPSNVLFSTREKAVKILDMGMVLIEQSQGDPSRITQDGLIIGTPDYIAPEQARNSKKADARADLYALGGTLYFLLTGQVPYPGGTTTEKLVRHATEPVPDASRSRPDLPPLLLAVLVRLLAKKPEDRFASAGAAAAALEPFCRPGTAGASALLPAHSAVLAGAAATEAADPSTETRFRLPPEDDVRPVRKATNLVPALLAAAGVAVVVVGSVLFVVSRPGGSAREESEARFENDFRMSFVRIDPGKFVMGSPADEPARSDSEGPTREVEISRPFYALVTEVKRGHYATLIGNPPTKATVQRDAEHWPVDGVSWGEAVAFCAALNAADSRKRPGYAYRLPTEAEWEYACRAGTKTRFWPGDRLTPNRNAFFDPDGDAELVTAGGGKPKGPTRAGRLAVNPWGLADVHGNLWEWCADYFDETYYGTDSRRDPKGPAIGDRRVLRGGAWDTPAGKCRSAARWGQPPDACPPDAGFRVVWGPE